MAARNKEVQIIKPIRNGINEAKIRVGAYCRVSTDSEDQLNSFFAQVKYYNDYIRENENMQLVDIYADEGITGTSIQKRDEFKRMIKDAKNRKLDRILVKSVTRFARNSLECIESVRLLKSCGVNVLFENDNIDTECMNSEMILYIKSAFAQGEAMSASKRMQTSVRMKMEDGTYIAASVPFGYRLENNEMTVVPEEAERVREIYRMYLSGKGTSVILKHLQATETNGVIWSENGVKYILKNERYIGDSLWQKRFTPNILPLRSKMNKGELPKYYCENTHEAIITREDFKAVQELLKKRSVLYKPPKEQKEFLSGKIRCRKCGWVYKRRYKNGILHWTCSRKGKDMTECHAPAYSDTDIRCAFVKMFNTLKRNERVVIGETIGQLSALKTKINSGNDAIAEIDAELFALSKNNDTYSELFLQGVIDSTIYFEQTDALKQKIYELRNRRSKLINEDENEQCLEELRQLRKTVNNTEYLTEMSEEVFEKTVETVFVEQDGTLTFRVKGGLELKVEG